MKILFATNNAHKLAEVRAVLGDDFTLVTPRDCGVTEEVPETQPTLEGNAAQKARYLYERTGCDCFADDTGLEVEALSVLHFISVCPSRKRHELMSEANRENRNLCIVQLLDLRDDRSALFRVSGAVREHDAVRI